MTRRPAYHLEGELRSFPPSLLLQMLSLSTLDGRLVLRTPHGSGEVFFERGRLVTARGPDPVEPLGAELVRRGLAPAPAVERAAAEQARRGGRARLGTILLEQGVVRRDDLDTVLRERVKASLCRLLEWREGRFAFEVGVQAEDRDFRLEGGLDSLLLECMTRLDDARARRAGAGEPRA